MTIVKKDAVALPDSFGEWVAPHVARMARLAARLAPSAERDDIVQEALARAWLKHHQYDSSRGTPASWLLAITADQARKAVARHRPPPAGLGVPVGANQPDDLLDVERALRGLTARQRLAVECVYFVDLSIAETALVMRCAEGTVKSTLADARAKLRTLLEVSE